MIPINPGKKERLHRRADRIFQRSETIASKRRSEKLVRKGFAILTKSAAPQRDLPVIFERSKRSRLRNEEWEKNRGVNMGRKPRYESTTLKPKMVRVMDRAGNIKRFAK